MYYGVGIIILAALGWLIWATFLNTAPTCFDGKQNGTERGVDCDGSCALICNDTAKQPTVAWARSFQSGTNSYTVAAYIKNNNVGAGAKGVAYSFQLFDANNNLVIEKEGTANLPPVQTIPLIETNISVGNRTVTHVQFAFTKTPPAVWGKVLQSRIPILHITQQNLSSDASRLSAYVVNDTLNDAKNVTAAAVLFDSGGVARAASKSLVTVVPAHGTASLVFTWPGGNPDIVRAEITLLPSF